MKASNYLMHINLFRHNIVVFIYIYAGRTEVPSIALTYLKELHVGFINDEDVMWDKRIQLISIGFKLD